MRYYLKANAQRMYSEGARDRIAEMWATEFPRFIAGEPVVLFDGLEIVAVPESSDLVLLASATSSRGEDLS